MIDDRIYLPAGNIFRYPSNVIAPLPEGATGYVTFQVAREIEQERKRRRTEGERA